MIKISDEMHSQIHLYKLKEDYDNLLEQPLKPRKGKKKPWQLTYDPEILEKEHGKLLMADFTLTNNQLKKQAVECSNLRE